MPPGSANTRKPATSASETRFEIVMVKRSLAAANAIKAGNSRRRAMSRIMDLLSRAAGARSEHRPSLAGRSEQSENGPDDHQILKIRVARTSSASASARQTSPAGALPRGAGSDRGFAATAAASGLRIVTPLPFDGKTKAPDHRGL